MTERTRTDRLAENDEVVIHGYAWGDHRQLVLVYERGYAVQVLSTFWQADGFLASVQREVPTDLLPAVEAWLETSTRTAE